VGRENKGKINHKKSSSSKILFKQKSVPRTKEVSLCAIIYTMNDAFK
jgi:hypothetical protein